MVTKHLKQVQGSTFNYRWLTPQESYLNGYKYPLKCLSIPGDVSEFRDCSDTVCDLVNCASNNVGKAFSTISTNRCLPVRRRRAVQDDDVILPDDIPLPPVVNTSTPVGDWPTRGGIDEQEANSLCRGQLQNLTSFISCQNYVNVSSLVMTCMLDVGVSNALLIILNEIYCQYVLVGNG